VENNTFRHCNGNLLAAVDVETTGINPLAHDVWQVGILPLNRDLEPMKGVHPFYMSMKPQRPENINYNAVKISRFNFLDLMKYAVEQDYAADLLDTWLAGLNLPLGKKIMPIWSNGHFDRDFLTAWLGCELYNQIFHGHTRDTQELAVAINDRFALAGKDLPFNRVGLNSLAPVLGIENENPHDALSDCLTTAAVYKALLRMELPNIVGSTLRGNS
jgi:DNA polymerase III epsilon subunit-like protein